jgi:hypothetical protein
MFLPGSPCGCCGGAPCQPCQYCAPPCLTVTFEGFAHGTGNCGECDFLDDTTFELKRPPDPQLSVTASVPSATGSGATFSVTTARNATDGSYVVSGIKLLTGGANYSIGDTVAFQTNGCFAVTPTASITIATTQPVSTNLRMASPSSAISPYTNTPGNISVTYSEQTDGEGNKFWTVSKLGAIGGGFGYAENQTVTLTPGWLSNPFYVDAEPGVVVQTAATARILTTQRIMPLIQGRIAKAVGEDVTFQSGQYGLITLSEGTDANGRAVWSIASISTGWWFPSDFTSGDTVQITVPSGVTAVQPAIVTLTVNSSGAVTAFNIVNGGVYYTTSGRPETVELLTGGAYYKPGVITSVTLTSGGKVWGPQVQESGLPVCVYESDGVCAVCPSESGNTLFARIQLGATSHTFRLVRRTPQNVGTLILEATRPALDEQGNRIPCDELTFGPEHFSEQYSCVTNGTVTVTQGACGDSSSSGCDLPDQITLSASGIPLVMWHGSSYGYASSEGWARGFADHCGISPYCLISETTGGGISNSWRANLVARDESSIVLDRDQNPGECGISYSGVMPSLPSISRSFNNPYPFGEEDCGGALEGRGVSVTISPVAADTSVFVSAPPWGQFGATAEATVTGGAVASIAVTNGGEGYAREVFARTEPTMTVTLSGGSGSGVVLSATLTQSGAGEEAYWYVSAVAVTNGGTGYSGQESVVFTPEEGATTTYPANAVVNVGRIEPTLTASVSPGSGADLSITLGEGFDWFTGQSNWYVQSVAVNNGGTGYVDGDDVAFTVTDGVQSWPASATIATGRTEPDVTADVAYSSGTGAVLTPSLSASGNAWTVSGLTITTAGTGYSQYDGISFATDDLTEAGGYGYVTSVDGNGAITGVAINYGGSYYRSTGVIQSVSVSDGGSYYKSTGVIEGITVWDGGSYYKEESTGTSQVDTPQVTISSNVGEGATAAAVIDGTLGSPTFGQITSINVTSGGQGYGSGGSRWRATIQYNGEIFHAGVADRVSANPCPSDLLSKSYAMSFSVRSIPGAFDDGCGEPDSATVDAIYSSITNYRWDGITVSLSSA